jgi:hypothetical protein
VRGEKSRPRRRVGLVGGLARRSIESDPSTYLECAGYGNAVIIMLMPRTVLLWVAEAAVMIHRTCWKFSGEVCQQTVVGRLLAVIARVKSSSLALVAVVSFVRCLGCKERGCRGLNPEI